MKKVLFFVLVLFTYYLAGMYRSLPLMVLCVMELMLIALLFVQPRCLKKKLSLAFLKACESAEEGSGARCRIKVQNLNRLPVNQFKVSLRIRYPQDSRSVRKKIYGSAERGENNVEFEIYARYCGLLHVRMSRLQVSDYLGLFSSGKLLAEEMKIAVFPKEYAFDIRSYVSALEQGSQPEEWTVNRWGTLMMRSVRYGNIAMGTLCGISIGTRVQKLRACGSRSMSGRQIFQSAY